MGGREDGRKGEMRGRGGEWKKGGGRMIVRNVGNSRIRLYSI